jgi:hypothetical protein
MLDSSEDARERGIGIRNVDGSDDPGGPADVRPRSLWAATLDRLRRLRAADVDLPKVGPAGALSGF